MLQIRLSKGPSLDGNGGATAGKASLVENVTVACPDHLIIADLPVAKSLGFTSSASIVKIVGRRSRRQLGQRIHFCVRCDFPIAVYGRLSPCEHAFCLDCARSESICYLCDERIHKIQTIRMLEGIFICAAPHCLKSFTKRPDFESHINHLHSDLLRPSSSLDPDQETLTHQPVDGAAPNPDPNQTLKPSFSPPLPAPSDHTPPPPPPLLRPLRPLFPFPSSPFHQPDYRPWSHKPPLEPPPSSDETALPQRPTPTFSPFPYYTPPPPDQASASLLGFPPTVALSAGLPRPPSWNSFPFTESMRGQQQQQQQQQVRDGKGILAPPVHLFQPPSFSPSPHL